MKSPAVRISAPRPGTCKGLNLAVFPIAEVGISRLVERTSNLTCVSQRGLSRVLSKAFALFKQ